MNLNEYQDAALETAVFADDLSIIYPCMGLANEAGEVLGKVKKALRDNNREFDEETCRKIADELGDVAWYLAASARGVGFTLDQICQMNIDKLRDRKERNVIHGSGDNR